MNKHFFRVKHYLEKWISRLTTGLINLDIKHNCHSAEEYLKGRSVKVLVDNCVLGQASTTHKTYSYKKTVEWPEGVKNELDMVSMDPVYIENENKQFVENISYIPGIIYLFSQGYVQLFTSDVLQCEQRSQPIGRYHGRMGVFDYDFFENVQMKSIDGYEAFCHVHDSFEWKDGKIHFKKIHFRKSPTFNGIISSTDIDPFGDCPNAKGRLGKYLSKKQIEITEFDSLVECLGKRNMQDAWHIYTAEIYKLDYFMTIDFKLLKALNAQRHNDRIQSLNVQIVNPKQFAQMIHMDGICQGNIRWLNKNTVLP